MRYYVVDVFTDRLFSGNPAGVCLLDEWLDDGILLSIAKENNLAETAFLVKQPEYYELRWFTPELEVDLCGHATMGSSFVLFEHVEPRASKLDFMTLSGPISVQRADGGMLWMDLPSRPGKAVKAYRSLVQAFDSEILETYLAPDIMVVFSSEQQVREAKPDFKALSLVKAEAGMPSDDFGVIVTAPADPGRPYDFVSRFFFAPNLVVNEDPVTGRAHCVLTPYWSKRLGKANLTARQLSSRGGQIWCEDASDRVRIGGQARLYLTGEIKL